MPLAERLARAKRLLAQRSPLLARLADFLQVSVMPHDEACDLCCGVGTLQLNASFLAQVSAENLAYWLAHASLHMALAHFEPPPGAPKAWSQQCDAEVANMLAAWWPQALLRHTPFLTMRDDEFSASPYATPPSPQPSPARGEGAKSWVHMPQVDQPLSLEGRGAGERVEPSAVSFPFARECHHWWIDAGEDSGHTAQQRMGAARSEQAPEAAQKQGEAARWRARLQQAAGEAFDHGAADAVLLRALLGSVPTSSGQNWRAKLAAYLQQWHQACAHYARPSRRAQPPLLLPALRPAAAHLLLAVDVSASIRDAQLQMFWAEIQALAGQISLHITLLAADSRLAPGAPWVFAPGEVPLWPQPQGQGGTDFRPVFAWLEQSGQNFDALLYFTDGKGDYPPHPPSLPVLWVLAGEGDDVRLPPFGEVLML